MKELVNYPLSLIEYPDNLKDIVSCGNPTILEIGCNDGSDTKKLLDFFPPADLFCFEPEPRAIRAWKGKGLKAQIFQVALTNYDGKGNFYQSSGSRKKIVDRDWDLSGSLNKPTGHVKYSPWVRFKSIVEVECRRLDGIAEELGIGEVDLIWMDVQGGERNVIEGGRFVLERTNMLYTEYGHWREPLYEGQMDLEETIEVLGPGWEPIATYEGCNVLVRNNQVKS